MAWWARWKFPNPKWTIPDVTAERSYVGAKKALASDAAADDCVEVPNVLVMFVLLSHSGVGGFVVDAEPAMLPSAYPACCGGTKRPADRAKGRKERLSALRRHSFTVLPVTKGGGIPVSDFARLCAVFAQPWRGRSYSLLRAPLAFRRKIDIILISPRFAGRKWRSRRRASNVSGVRRQTVPTPPQSVPGVGIWIGERNACQRQP